MIRLTHCRQNLLVARVADIFRSGIEPGQMKLIFKGHGGLCCDISAECDTWNILISCGNTCKVQSLWCVLCCFMIDIKIPTAALQPTAAIRFEANPEGWWHFGVDKGLNHQWWSEWKRPSIFGPWIHGSQVENGNTMHVVKSAPSATTASTLGCLEHAPFPGNL